MLSPAWSASIVQLPAARIVTVRPETEHAELEVENDTPRLDDEDALRLKAASPYVLPGREPNVIDWDSLFTVTVTGSVAFATCGVTEIRLTFELYVPSAVKVDDASPAFKLTDAGLNEPPDGVTTLNATGTPLSSRLFVLLPASILSEFHFRLALTPAVCSTFRLFGGDEGAVVRSTSHGEKSARPLTMLHWELDGPALQPQKLFSTDACVAAVF